MRRSWRLAPSGRVSGGARSTDLCRRSCGSTAAGAFHGGEKLVGRAVRVGGGGGQAGERAGMLRRAAHGVVGALGELADASGRPEQPIEGILVLSMTFKRARPLG